MNNNGGGTSGWLVPTPRHHVMHQTWRENDSCVCDGVMTSFMNITIHGSFIVMRAKLLYTCASKKFFLIDENWKLPSEWIVWQQKYVEQAYHTRPWRICTTWCHLKNYKRQANVWWTWIIKWSHKSSQPYIGFVWQVLDADRRVCHRAGTPLMNHNAAYVHFMMNGRWRRCRC